MAVGGYHSLGLKTDGSIVAWGENEMGQCDVPEPNSDFIAVAAGGERSLGLKADGSIVIWGAGSDQVPEPNSGFVAISTSGAHNLGLKADGSIVAWGYNSYGQCDVPEPNSDFVAVSAGGYHSLGLKVDGSIVSWGNPNSVPIPNRNFVAISAVSGGYNHSLGLKTNGSIVAWGGSDWYGENTPPSGNSFIAVAAGGTTNFAIVQICEYSLFGDVNNDCKVDFYDFAQMASNWMIDCFDDPENPACVPK
jgi:alpha-tubulin suppressor-like RCC1 family protein